MAVNKGLGRGLSALFSDTEAEYEHSSAAAPAENGGKTVYLSDGEPKKLKLGDIFANPNQPRKTFDRTALEDLADSVSEHGILQPILVTPQDGRYMILAGERRFRAAGMAGLTEIPVYVKDCTPKEIREISLIENLQREDLNPVEAASAMRQLMDEYSLTQEDLSRRLGKSRSAVANLLRLLTLPAEVLAYLRDGRLTEGHGRALIGLAPLQAASVAQIAAERGLSVRETEKAARDIASGGLSGGRKKAPKPADYGRQSRELKDLITTMQRVLGTKVTAVGTDTKGRIFIDYFSPDDIDRIFDVIDKLK